MSMDGWIWRAGFGWVEREPVEVPVDVEVEQPAPVEEGAA